MASPNNNINNQFPPPHMGSQSVQADFSDDDDDYFSEGFSDDDQYIVEGPVEAPEPSLYNDDESLDHQSLAPERNSENETGTLQMKTYTEVSAVSQSSSPDNFTTLINLRAPHAQVSGSSRVPIDLVMILDTSVSMEGSKLALLKRATGFVIQNLRANDRLSVVVFSCTARRLFPLRKMSESGKQEALRAVNLLEVEASTNIAAGLRKGAKVLEDRRYKNPVASIMLLSDGQDNYTLNGRNRKNYRLLAPPSIDHGKGSNFRIPVHTFGFGSDHDASLMHSIAEISRGTFSFVETERMIQDAFAQCIGGLLSVVVKELQVNIECVDSRVSISSLRTGSYLNQVTPDGRMGNIDVGDLYADEEKDFLVAVKVPTEMSSSETPLLKVRCVYNDPLTKDLVTVKSEEVRISRPEVAGQQEVSVEVDRQQNRLQATEAMALAQAAAEAGDLSGAASILENCQKKLSESVSAKGHDMLCLALEDELKEMQEKLANRSTYERSGRAMMLSGMNSHMGQRATAACLDLYPSSEDEDCDGAECDDGDDDDDDVMGFSLYDGCDGEGGGFDCRLARVGCSSGREAPSVRGYQTPAMAKMVARSRATKRRKGKKSTQAAKALGTIDESNENC